MVDEGKTGEALDSRRGEDRERDPERGGVSGVHPRWFLRNRTRSPDTEVSRPRPKSKARPVPRTCTTTEVRLLRPPLPRHGTTTTRDNHGEPAASTSTGAGSSGDRPEVAAQGQTRHGNNEAAMQEEHAVDAWRFLLGMDPENFEAGVDVVAAGQPLLPQYVSEMVTETMSMYSAQDRAIMTIAFVRFVRMLMAEVSQAFERGVLAGHARTRNEVLVDVAVEPEQDTAGDGMSLMQRTLTGQFKSGTGKSWYEKLQAFQRALSELPPPARNANIQGLQARSNSGGGVEAEQLESLRAVLIAMMEPGDQGLAVGDVNWQLQWWTYLFRSGECEVPTSSSEAAQFRSLPAPPPLTDEDLETKAQEEREIRQQRESQQRERERQQDQHEEEEAAFHAYQEGLQDGEDDCDGRRYSKLTAQALKQWEDWEWFQIMQGPPSKRSRMSLEVTMGGGLRVGGPWLSRSLRLPFASTGQPPELSVSMRLVSERPPEEVETELLQPQGQAGVQEETIAVLNEAGEVRRIGGEGLLDLMQAQRILDTETQEEGLTGSASPTEAEQGENVDG